MSDKANEYEGYKEKSKEILQEFNAKTWSRIKIANGKRKIEGIILPRNKFAEDGYVDIKLDNGYNIGFELNEETEIEVLGRNPPMEVKFEQSAPQPRESLPDVTLLGTGGTIASRLDYNTGGVIPAFEPGELLAAVPELKNICNLDTEVVYKIFSEDMKPKYWLKMAKKIEKV
ncbi:MAG TPA: asparaginase domain-containing protein, partial [Patescibacteria group bacterium]|nr:asparaginase domain-containing protein [Patescibacteria group bacterium]